MHGYSNASPKGRGGDALSFRKGGADAIYSLGSVEGPTVGSGGDSIHSLRVWMRMHC